MRRISVAVAQPPVEPKGHVEDVLVFFVLVGCLVLGAFVLGAQVQAALGAWV